MKVLKIAALVITAVVTVGVGAAIIGGASLAAAVSGVAFGLASSLGLTSAAMAGILAVTAAIDLGMLGSLLAKPSSGGSQTKWKADPYAGIPYVMGRTLVGGNIVYRRGHGTNNKYETFVTILSLGAIASLDTTFLNRTTVAFDGGGNATGTYHDHVWQRSQLGATPESAALLPPVDSPPGWTTAHKLSGLAAVMQTLAYDSSSDSGLTTEPAPSHIVHGVLIYDPRADSTYPGGSGSCRALDESTYVWSENPHLHALTWCLGRWQNGVRVAGIGAPLSTIDIAAFVEGANLDDARGWTIGGQIVTRPDTPWNSLKTMLQAGGAVPVLSGGIISCINRAPRVSLATITHGDIAGDCSFAGTQPRRSRINGIIPQYRSEANDWEMVSASGISVADYVTLDGDERTREITYSLVQNVDQVAQLAAYDICDAREAGPGTVPLKPAWLNYRVGDCITFAPEDGWLVKAIITGRAIDAQAATVTYTLRSETDAKHPFALGLTGIAPPTASLSYDGTIAAPGSDWTLSGATLADGGAAVPALVLTGATSNSSADAVVIDYRVYSSGLGVGDGWIGGSIEAPTLTRKEITSVTPGTQYQLGVRYRVRGVLGQRSIYGPVAAGDSYPPGYLRTLVSGSSTIPAFGLLMGSDAGTTATIVIADHVRVYGDKTVSISGVAAITGLAYSTTYYVYYDDAGRAGGAVSAHVTTDATVAAISDSNPYRHSFGAITTPAHSAANTTGGGVLDYSTLAGINWSSLGLIY